MTDKPTVRVPAGSRRIEDSFPAFAQSVERGLVNQGTGLGTARDKGAQGAWRYGALDHVQLEAMYRTSWLARKGVDTPVYDMLRQGWTLGLAEDQTSQLKMEMRRIGFGPRLISTLIWGRLFGGAGLYLGTNDTDLSEPLDASRIRKGGLTYIAPIPRNYLTTPMLETDPLSPAFRMPRFYQVASASKVGQKIHHSRMIRVCGNERPTYLATTQDSWGDSILEPVEQTIRDFTAGQRGIANILQEASLDVVSIKGMMQGLISGGEVYEDALKRRVQISMDLKSIMNALMLDGEDSYDKKPANFANLDAIGMFHLKLVAAAFGMPMTKFLGQSPQGMNSTGDGDERNYHDTLSGQQENWLRPVLEKLLRVVLPSAGLDADAGALAFNPLRQMTDKELVENAERKAKTLETYDRVNAVPDGVLAEMARGAILDDETLWPGARNAYAGYTGADGTLRNLVDPEETDMSETDGLDAA